VQKKLRCHLVSSVFGSGHNLGLQISTSKFNQYYVLNTTDPYFTEDGVSRTFELYHRSSKPYVEQGGNYRLVTSGLGVRFGIPFSELDRVFVGTAAERTELVQGTNMTGSQTIFCMEFGCVANNVPVTLGWARDSRDSYLNPNSGKLIRLNSELGAFGDARYTKVGTQYQQYFPITKQYTFAFNFDLGLGKGLNGQALPFYKNYYSGGLGSVRGFEQGTLGPRGLTALVEGGAKKITLNSEFLMPFPGAGNDRTLRLYGFYDVGNVYGEYAKFDPSLLRTSYGVGLSWVSPMGPLRFAWARPGRTQSGDRIQQLQFQIGTSF
jgi:outer membrane protein insertion porin family